VSQFSSLGSVQGLNPDIILPRFVDHKGQRLAVGRKVEAGAGGRVLQNGIPPSERDRGRGFARLSPSLRARSGWSSSWTQDSALR
jgi:hypothetical protein